MIQVKATREGLVGKTTYSGYVIDTVVPFVALPSVRAIHRLVRIVNVLLPDVYCYAFVLDVGPWNEHDDAYVFSGARPQAESGKDASGRVTNGAGIDFGQYVWNALGMKDNGLVQWEFIGGTV